MAGKLNGVHMIFLTGMPAAGKTYWASQIAEAHALQFLDLDVHVAEQEKASIQALFAMYGENGFREREQKHLKQIIRIATTNTIVACGGGTPCFGDNMQLMKQAGTVIYLQAEIPELLAYLKDADQVRPLLVNRGDLAVYLADMLKKRKKYYEEANHILHTKDISIATFGEIISSCINRP